MKLFLYWVTLVHAFIIVLGQETDAPVEDLEQAAPPAEEVFTNNIADLTNGPPTTQVTTPSLPSSSISSTTSTTTKPTTTKPITRPSTTTKVVNTPRRTYTRRPVGSFHNVRSLPAFISSDQLAAALIGKRRLINVENGKKSYPSSCRCSRLSHCPKLQISVPRCPPEQFLCCFPKV